MSNKQVVYQLLIIMMFDKKKCCTVVDKKLRNNTVLFEKHRDIKQQKCEKSVRIIHEMVFKDKKIFCEI
jgi:hypothetical protein